MTEESQRQTPQAPLIEEKQRWSPIWLMPLIALCVAAWLGAQAWQERGIKITVTFQNGMGIEAGRTQVRFNGLQVGKVETVSMQPDLKGVQAKIIVSRDIADWLTDKTDFWLVKPEISLAGVSGIEALLSGNYITFRPEKGKTTHHFKALAEAPPLAEGKPGLHISLEALDAGSIIPGSPVYYRHIHVGEVERIALKGDGHSVQIDIYIEPNYAGLVRENSRFWNVSGIHINGPLSQLKIEIDSLLSVLKGGVAFATPDWEPKPEAAGQHSHFKLYPDYESARSGIPVTIEFPLSAHIVQEGARIMFHGVEAGIVKSYVIKEDISGFIVHASMDPLAAPALVDGARFWLVEPRVTPQGVEGLDALISGRYIAMDVTDKAIKADRVERSFKGHTTQPPAGSDAPGLHVTLVSDNANGLSTGSTVWLRGIEIGTVQGIYLRKEGVDVAILIEKQFQHLMREGATFWKASGVSVSAGIDGVTVNSRPLSAIISGGIFCESSVPDAMPIADGAMFELFPDRQTAYRRGRLVTLFSPTLSSVKDGAPVFYKGVIVGEVVSVDLANPADRVEIRLMVNSPYESLVTDDSRFWNVSGLAIEIGALKGIEVHTQSVQALIQGGIAFATPRIAHPAAIETSFLLHKKAETQWLQWNPSIPLIRSAKEKMPEADK